MSKTQQLEIDKAKKFNIKKAKAYTSSVKMAILTISAVVDPSSTYGLDIKTLQQEINTQVEEVLQGNTSGIETTLMSQVKTLELIFNTMASKAAVTEYLKSAQAYMDFALRAQNQCRKTLLALAAIKHPPQQQIVGQQNIAFNQQVNNEVLDNKVLQKKSQKIKSENELISETKHETLDSGRTLKTSTINQNPTTVEMVNRRPNTTRQSYKQNERL